MESGYDYLESCVNHEKKLSCATAQDFSLDAIKKVLNRLGDPQKNVRYVHVAGSKGKGSVCAMTAEVLRQAGYRVGLYTSPHLYDIRERIRILNPQNAGEQKFDGCISRKDLEECLVRVKDAAESRDPCLPAGRLRTTDLPRPAILAAKRRGGQDESSFEEAQKKIRGLTYFEILTAAAFLYFDKNKIDIGILETGLGGRLDATNVVDALVCAITKIDLEHVNILGHSLEEIAREKAGIIKKGCRHVVLGYQEDKESVDVLMQRCADCNIVAVQAGKDSVIEEYHNRAEAENKAICLEIYHALRNEEFSLDDAIVIKAMDEVFWPGRMETVETKPLIILDGAHTPIAVTALMPFADRMTRDKKKVLILGISEDKNKEELSAILRDFSDTIILTKSQHVRAYQWQEKDRMVFRGKDVVMIDNSQQALQEAKRISGKEGAILITGSLFLAAEMRAIICEQPIV